MSNVLSGTCCGLSDSGMSINTGMSINNGRSMSKGICINEQGTVTLGSIDLLPADICTIGSLAPFTTTKEQTIEEKLTELVEKGTFEQDEDEDYIIGYIPVGLKGAIDHTFDPQHIEIEKTYGNSKFCIYTKEEAMKRGIQFGPIKAYVSPNNLVKDVYDEVGFKILKVAFKKENIISIYCSNMVIKEIDVLEEVEIPVVISFYVNRAVSKDDFYELDINLLNETTGKSAYVQVRNDTPTIEQELLVEKIQEEITICLALCKTKAMKGVL